MNPSDIVPEFAPVLIGKVGLSPHDDVFGRDYPNLALLLLPKYNAAKRLTREAGTIGVKVDGSLWRVTLACPTEGCQTVLETVTLVDLLTQLELHVTRPDAVWTPTYDAKKKSRRGLDKALDT